MQPFRFRTAAQATADAATADEALDYALSEAHSYETRMQLFVGIAGRPDITRAHVKTILDDFHQRGSKILTTLWANPAVARDPDLAERVISRIGRDDIFAFALAPNSVVLLPRLLAKCANPHFPDHATYVQFLNTIYTAEQIADALNVLVEEFEQSLYAEVGSRSPLSDLLMSPLLSAQHLTRVVEMVEQALSGAATPLPSGRSRRRTADYEERIHRFAIAQDVIATLLSRTDLTEAECLTLVKCAEKVVEDAVAYSPPSQRKWARATNTGRMFRNAQLTPQAMAYAFNAPAFRISLTDLRLDGIGVSAALSATTHDPNPILVQRVLDTSFSLDEPAVEALLSQVRILEDRYRMPADAPADGDPYDDDDMFAWGHTDKAWWSTSGQRSDKHEQRILDGLINAGHRHIGTPVWDAVYAYVLAHPRHEHIPHMQVVDHVAEVVCRSTKWADDSMTPVAHVFAEWASASDDEHLRRHAVAQCWEVAQLHQAVLDPSPLVRIEVLKHDLATADVVYAAARDTDAQVRLAAAEHDHIDQRTISVLSNDPDENVRTAIAHRVLDSLRA